MVVARVYVAEVSPAATRGFLTALPEVAVNAGLLLGYVSNFAFAYLSVQFSWRLMFALGSVPAILLGFGTFAMPESPRWLVMKGQLGKAREVMLRTYQPLTCITLITFWIKSTFNLGPMCWGQSLFCFFFFYNLS